MNMAGKKNKQEQVNPQNLEKVKKSPTTKRATNKGRKQKSNKPGFPIVGIGASAGGLEALQELFVNMPSDSGMAFVLVPHLDPSHASLLPELLKKYTRMSIFEAQDNMRIDPDRMYIIPRNKDMEILNGALRLSEPSQPHGLRLPIDFFFRSLAREQGAGAVGVILSGTGTDGTLGLRDIKAESGIVIIQAPENARYNGMPKSAIATDLADFILPAEEIPQQLIELTKHYDAMQRRIELRPEEKSPELLQKVFSLLRKHTRHDFSQYKESTIQRRIERRMNIRKLHNLTEYIPYLEEHPEEAHALFKDILISVTGFFRDPEAFESLKTHLLKLISQQPSGEPLRAWVPGCSIGEEAYSIAIIFRECLDELGRDTSVQIFATDVDDSAIEVARSGSYPLGISTDISPERLKRFFSRSGHTYSVKKEIREMLVFAVQDITRDPPFSKVDVVCCRNLLIYMNTELQKKLLPLLHYALNKGGILLLGPSETIGGFNNHFSVLDKKWKIYKRTELASANNIYFPPITYTEKGVVPAATVKMPKPTSTDLPNLVQKTLLNDYTPSCIVIDYNYDIQYVHGATGKYLQLPAGPMTANITELGREGLKSQLASAIRRVINGEPEVTHHSLRVQQDGGHLLVDLTVKQLSLPAESKKLLLVLFQDVVTEVETKSVKSRGKKDVKTDEHIAMLEDELKNSKESLQTTIEELETSNEELKSSNEELQSTNEELQSTNEELETSREELQSVNEELLTVNTEHQVKIDELSTANDDIKNLLDSTNVPVLLIDNNLYIRRYTATTNKIFNIIESDIGRPLHHLTSNLQHSHLLEDAEKVLETLVPKEAEVQSEDGQWYNSRIIPFRTTENAINGLVITFLDITNVKKATEEKAARAVAEAIIETVREPIIILDNELRIVSVNKSFYDTFRVSVGETIGHYIYDLGNRQWNIPRLRHLLEEILPRNTSFSDFEVEHNFPNIGYYKMLLNARRVLQKTGERELILLSIGSLTKGRQTRKHSERK
jgi:two-component system CheB/CheR fusion protein